MRRPSASTQILPGLRAWAYEETANSRCRRWYRRRQILLRFKALPGTPMSMAHGIGLCSLPVPMGSLDERVAYMEGRMEDHAALFADIRAEMRALRGDMTALRGEFTGEMRAFRTEMDRRFTWMIGLLIAVLTGMAGLAFQVSRLPNL